MNAELIIIQIILFMTFVLVTYFFATHMIRKYWPSQYIHYKDGLLNLINIVSIFAVFIFVMIKVFTMVNYGPKYTVGSSTPFIDQVDRKGQFEQKIAEGVK